MTSIKPPLPGAPTAPHLSGEVEGSGATSAGAPLQSFNEALGRAESVSGQAPVVGAGADPLAAMAQELGQGKLSVEQALDRLVERAASGPSQNLSEAERADLRSLLRDALGADPTLGALREELGR